MPAWFPTAAKWLPSADIAMESHATLVGAPVVFHVFPASAEVKIKPVCAATARVLPSLDIAIEVHSWEGAIPSVASEASQSTLAHRLPLSWEIKTVPSCVAAASVLP